SAVSSIANRVANAALAGAAFGAASAGMTGGNVAEGALAGGAAWAAGEGVNMMVGHAFGYIASGKAPTFDAKNGVFIYDAPSLPGAITFGNVITGGKSFLNSTVQIAGADDPKGRQVLDHELSHTSQGTIL